MAGRNVQLPLAHVRGEEGNITLQKMTAWEVIISTANNIFLHLRPQTTVQQIQLGPPNVFLPTARRVDNKRIGVAVAFRPITIAVKFYFSFERESVRSATRMCTSTLLLKVK